MLPPSLKHSLNKIPGLDYVAVGEAEYSLLALANNQDPASIDGIFTRCSNSSNFPRSTIKNIDDLPLPDYSIFDMEYYTRANTATIKRILLKISLYIILPGMPF
ncbi:MAG: hypothetical protein U5N58_02725 [Actinomycetota bacterium]|nr:hypothetical protein [Actinomycetota bacterium]